MTYCTDCEEWVELDEGRCPWCDKILLKKKKRKVRENDMDFMDGEEFIDLYEEEEST